LKRLYSQFLSTVQLALRRTWAEIGSHAAIALGVLVATTTICAIILYAEAVNVAVLRDRLARTHDLLLSSGQQQRLCIARAFANRPALTLADETTGELDSRTGQEILSLFRQIVALVGTALVVATHDPIVHDHASIVYELADGRLTCSADGRRHVDGAWSASDEAQHG